MPTADMYGTDDGDEHPHNRQQRDGHDQDRRQNSLGPRHGVGRVLEEGSPARAMTEPPPVQGAPVLATDHSCSRADRDRVRTFFTISVATPDPTYMA